MDRSASRNEQATDDFNKEGFQGVIKKLQAASFTDGYPGSSRKAFTGTNDQNKKQPEVIHVGSGDGVVTTVVSGVRKRTKITLYDSDIGDEEIPKCLTK